MGSLLRQMALLTVLGACGQQPSRPVEHSGSAKGAARPDWQPFSHDVFTRAAQERKLVLLSVQAGWCHWCHVMNATTYRDPAVIAFLRAHFITVRVEQDERPDLAQRYLRWGWPATALLNPDGTAIVNLRGHKPSARLLPLLRSVVQEWEAQGHVASRMNRPDAGTELSELGHARELARAQLDATYDAEQGGWGRPQKYPLPDPVEHALWVGQRPGEDARLAHARASLAGYRKLIDPVAGGMYQYSTHSHWDSPHFEKIAKVQAGAIHAFSLAHRVLGDASFLQDARRVVRYLASDFQSERGAFYTSQDADVGRPGSEGHIDGHRYYGANEAQRAAMRAPTIDRHIYADLNGMLISALAELAREDPEGPAKALAQRALAELMRTHLVDGDVRHDAEAEGAVRYLSDHVQVASAMARVAELTMDSALLARSDALLSATVARFGDAEGAAFFARTADPNAVGIYAERLKPYEDNALLARLLLRKGRRTHDEEAIELAEQALRALSNPTAIAVQGRRIAGYLLALEEADAGYVVARVVGPATETATRELHAAALALPGQSVMVVQEEAADSAYPYQGRPTLYLCSEDACSAPIQAVTAVAAAYDAFTSR